MKRILLFVLLFIILFSFSSCYSNKPTYDELSQQYDDLQEKYNNLMEVYQNYKSVCEYLDSLVIFDLWSCEDDIITLSGYFDGNDDFTFEETKNAFEHIDSVYRKYCHY